MICAWISPNNEASMVQLVAGSGRSVWPYNIKADSIVKTIYLHTVENWTYWDDIQPGSHIQKTSFHSHQSKVVHISFYHLCTQESNFKSITAYYLKNLPKQLTPSPKKPPVMLHKQLKLPRVLLQIAFTWQLCIPSRHSSRSENNLG